MKIVVLDGHTLNPGDLSWSGLERLGEVEVYDRTSHQEVIERAQHAEVLLTNKTVLDDRLIAALPKLRYIGQLATGYDTIDVEAAAKRSIPVCNVPGYSTESVTQLTWALILALVNRVNPISQSVMNGDWARSVDFSYGYESIFDLHGKTLGLVGLGDIGSRVAEVGRAFGMRVIAVVRNPDKYQIDGIEVTTDRARVFHEADVVSLHCPLAADNAQFVDAALLGSMKRSAYLVNTARGGLINEADLANALSRGVIAGAGLDVLSSEPPRSDNPLLSAQNCLITPHVGWASRESRQRLMDETVNNIEAFLAGRPRNVVNDVVIA